MTNKILLSAVLWLMIMFNICAQTATAPAVGDGSAGNPYQIATLDNLYWISQNSGSWGSSYIQTSDIDATSTRTWTNGFPPIASSGSHFTGTYDGQNHTIKCLYINLPSTDYVGLFSYMSGGLVKNVKLKYAGILGSSFVGGIVGRCDGGSNFDNCYITGNIRGYEMIGGIVGETWYAGTISTCYVTADIFGVNSFAGGSVGGFVGRNHSTTITNCYSTGIISGPYHCGGIAGYSIYTRGISDCYTTGQITTSVYIIGGITSWLMHSMTNCYNAGYVSNSSAAGINAGGIVAINDGSVSGCYWDIMTSGLTNGGAPGATGYNTIDMKRKSSFASFDFTSTWDIVEGLSYPALKNISNNAPFAFTEKIASGLTCPLSQLLLNDYDYETGQTNLVAKIESLSSGTYDATNIYFPGASPVGTVLSVRYRVGEKRPSENDTLWGNRITSTIVQIVNNPPVLSSVTNKLININTPITLSMSDVTASDVDGDLLSLVIGSGTNYSVVGNTITPATGFVGALSVPIQVNDGYVNSNTMTMTITVINGIVDVSDNPLTLTSNYGTLKEAFDKINDGTHQGTLTIKIKGSTTETSAAVLNSSGTGLASYSSITIYPTVTGLSISGSNSVYLINLAGADNVTFDGRVNMAGNVDLTIVNTYNGPSIGTIYFAGNACNNTIKYCIVKATAAEANINMLNTGNNDNTIDHCRLTADGNNSRNYIFCGSSSRLTVSNCEIFDFLGPISGNGISISTCDDSKIINNNFYQTNPVSVNFAGGTSVIINLVNGSNNCEVSGNYIGGRAPNCGGSPLTINATSNGYFRVIDCGASNTLIINNTISNINITGSVIVPVVALGTYGWDVETISGNKIYNITSSCGDLTGISTYCGAGPNIIESNFIHSLSSSSNLYGINCPNAGNVLTISNNIISFSATSGATSTYGIYDQTGTNSVYFNTIYMSGSGSGNSAAIRSTNNNTRNYRNNIFSAGSDYAIRVTSTSGLTIGYNDYVGSVDGISVDATSTTANPVFTNPGGTTATDYKPNGFAGNGINIGGITDDYSGSARPNPPTMGAIEGVAGNVLVYNSSNTLVGVYSKLQLAFIAINTNAGGTHNGALTVKIAGSTTETATCELVASGSGPGPANYTSVNIYPTASGLSVAGNLAAPLIDFNGADNVTLDGRLNATGITQDLTISNSSISSINETSSIRFINDATGNTVKYCTVKGSSLALTGGIIYLSTTTGTTGNDNNTINNCNITNQAGNRPLQAICSNGSTTAGLENSNLTISNCNIYDFLNPANASSGIYINYSTGCRIENNSFYETSTFTTSNDVAGYVIIYILSGENHTISGNYIGGSGSLCSGTWNKSNSFGNTFYGIIFQGSSNTVASNIQGNIIKNINWANNNISPFYGYALFPGLVNMGTVIPNTIESITFIGGAADAAFSGILDNFSSNGTNISNNTIRNITLLNSSALNNTNFYGIYKLSMNDTKIITGNTIENINATSSSSGNAQIMTGIYSIIGNSTVISENTISNMTNACTNAGSSVNGVYGAFINGTVNKNKIIGLSNAGGTGTGINASIIGIKIQAPLGDVNQSVSENTIFNLSNSGTATDMIGIAYQGSTGTNNVERNFIHSFSSTGTAPVFTGIQCIAGTASYHNNIISLSTGASVSAINGIGDIDGTNSIFFNTVHIGGTGSGTTSAILSSGTNTRNYRNNIFSNVRTGGTSNAVNISSTSGLTLGYNDYVGTLSGITLNTAPDNNSLAINPMFTNAGGTAAIDYLQQSTILAGSSGTTVLTDYANAARNATNPSMGAYEVPVTPLPTVQGTLTASYVHPGNIRLNISAGNGSNRVVFAIESTSVSANPVNGTTYTPNTSITLGSALGATNWHCVYNGNGSGITVDVSGIKPDKVYYFIIFEYNGTTGNQRYLIPSNGTNITIPAFVTVTGNSPVTSADYFTLKEGFDRINDGTHQGIVNVFIKNDLTENAACVLNASGFPSNYTSVLIQPNSTTNRLVSGNIASPLLQMAGADNFTIDGSFGGDNLKHLTFRNTNLTRPTVGYQQDATNNTNRFTIFEGANTNLPSTAFSGVVNFNTTAGITGNDNITIDNCDIRNCSNGAGNPSVLIGFISTGSIYNDNQVVRNSNLFNFTAAGIASSTAPAGDNYTVDNNNFYNTLSASNAQGAIAITGGNNHKIRNNQIGGQAANCGGASWKIAATNSDFGGIIMNPTGGNLLIDNNTIKNIEWTSGYGNFYGITVRGGALSSVTSNTVSNILSAVYATSKADFFGINSASTNSVTIRQNTISGLVNNIANTSVPTDVSYSCGINVNNSTTANITTNSVSNISSTAIGNIYIGGIFMTSAGNQFNISDNTVNNLFAANGYRLGGITIAGNNNNHTISNNRIWDIRSSFAGVAQIGGITITGGRADVFNNMISLGATDNFDHNIGGLVNQNNTVTASNFYYNSVYINGNSGVGSNFSTCVVLDNALSVFKNNILQNFRTGTGAAKHLNILTSPTGTYAGDYNDLVNADPSKTASLDFGLTAISLANWQTLNLKDIHSISITPTFTNTSVADLHVTDKCLAGVGTNLAGYTTDYDNQLRSNPPSIGADEIVGVLTPQIQASNIILSNGKSDQVKISWTNGSGARRKVFIKANITTGLATPVCGLNYTANSVFGLGQPIGISDWLCIYDGTGTSETVTGLSNPTSYRVMVVEYNENAGDIKYNIYEATNNPLNFKTQAITFNALPVKKYGNSDFDPNVVANSSLAVSCLSSDENIAKIVGGQVQIVKAGTCDITASQTGNTEYLPATSTTQNLTITKFGVTVTAEDKSKRYLSANPELTFTYSSFVAGEKSSVVVTGAPVLTTTATTTSTVGTYPISVNITALSADNYSFSAVNGTLTIINKEPQTITFAPIDSKRYGDPDFTLSAIGGASGNPVTFASSDNSIASITGNTVHIVKAGTCTITASQPGNDIYTHAPDVAQTLMITKARIEVKADTKSKRYLTDNPEFTFTYSGFVLSQTSAVITGAPVLSTLAITSSTVGTYPIIVNVTALGADNYSFLAVNGTLTIIDKDPQVITFNAIPAKTYGDGNFNVTATGGGSGNPVTFASSDISIATVTLTGGNVHIVKAGTCKIIASQLGNDVYTHAQDVEQTLTVNKVTITVTAENKQKGYNVDNSTLTFTYSPFVLGETSSVISGTPVITTTAVKTSPVVAGGYPITVNIAGMSATNYLFTAVNGVLTINKADQVISNFDDMTKALTDADFDPEANVNSPLSIVYESSDNSIASIIDNKVHIVSKGTCNITARQAGDGNYNPVSLTKILKIVSGTWSQTITFGSLGSKTYGDPDFDLNGSSSSGLPVVFSSSNTNVAVINKYRGGYKLQIVGAGTTVITVSQDGNDYYLPAPNVDVNFIVNKAALIVTAENKSKVYGCSNPELTFGYSGWVKGVEPITKTPSISCASISSLTHAGVYNSAIILCEGMDDNYEFNYVPGRMIITKAPLTITAENKNTTYGTMPLFTASYSGFVNGETSSVLDGTVNVISNATVTSNVGNYTITASQGSLFSNNYSFSFQSGILAISKATLTVKADDKTRQYGSINPELTVTYTGFMNNETDQVLDTKPEISTSATQTSNGGKYPITPCCGSDNNYELTYSSGFLTVLATKPGIENRAVIDFTSTSELLIAEYISSGGEIHGNQGFCYNILPNPTVKNLKVGKMTNSELKGMLDYVKAKNPKEYMANIMIFNNMNDNYFGGYLQGLMTNKVYFVRAYATNSEGTVYGREIIFKTSDGFTGIGDLQDYKFMVYPNPSEGKLTISSGIGFDQLSVIDVSGKIIYNEKLADVTHLKYFDFSMLSKGLYFLKVQKGNEYKIHKIVINW